MFPYFFLLFIFAGWLSAVFKEPFYAVIVYVFIYFNMPTFQWWGYAVPDLRYSLLATIVLLVSYYANRHRLKLRYISNDQSFKMLAALAVLMLIITPFAYNTAASWERAFQFVKYLVAYFLIVKTVTTVFQYKAVLYTFVLCFFYLGYVGRSYFTGQRLDGVGVVDASDANLLAAFILLIIPFLMINFFWGKKWDKIIVFFSAPFIMNLFVMTRSRGGFIGLSLSFISMLFLVKRFKNRLKILLPLVLFSIAIFYLADQSFVDRISSLFGSSDISSESSGRIETWGYGLQILFDHPFGVGGEGFERLSPKYLPTRLLEANLGVRVAHNTFLQVTVEQGYLGLLFYLLFLYFLIKKLHNIRKILDRPGRSETSRFIIYQTYALEAAYLGFLGAAFFVDRLYFEGIYLFCALSTVLYNLSLDQLDNQGQLKSQPSP